jgi:hypothetical protein
MLRFDRPRVLAGFIALMSTWIVGTCPAAPIDRLMDASGLRQALEQIPATVTLSIDAPQPGVEVPEDVRVALKDAATQAFRAEPIVESVRARLARDLSEREIADALAWLDAPLGKRITDLEMKASDPAAMSRIENYARELQRRAPPKARRILMQDLNVAMRATETGLVLMEAIAFAGALGLNAAHPRQARIPAELLQRKIKEALPELRAHAEANVTAGLFYTYRPLPDRELASYLSFLQSESGFAYSRSSAEAVREALTQATSLFMGAIPKALRRAQGSGRT